MNNDSPNVDRRTVLKGTAGAVLAGGAAVALTGSASAEHVETGVFAIDDIDEVESDSGRLSSLEISGIDVTVVWEGFNTEAEEVTWTLKANHEDYDDPVTIGTTTESVSGGSGTKDGSMDTVDLVEEFGVEAFEAAPHPDGADYADHTESWNINFSLEAEVTQVNGDTFGDTATGSSLTEVTNIMTDVTTSGNAEGEAETGDPASYTELSVVEGSEGYDINSNNKEEDLPYFDYTEGEELALTFHNPTDFYFSFDYRVDGEDGESDEWTGDEISEGPFGGQTFYDRYNTVSLDSGESETVYLQAMSEVVVYLQRGAEQNWYIPEVVFNGE